jgi:hypothetical protein
LERVDPAIELLKTSLVSVLPSWPTFACTRAAGAFLDLRRALPVD